MIYIFPLGLKLFPGMQASVLAWRLGSVHMLLYALQLQHYCGVCSIRDLVALPEGKLQLSAHWGVGVGARWVSTFAFMAQV